jgi:dTDP-4-dehydrorhamnose 3,5-epimerase
LILIKRSQTMQFGNIVDVVLEPLIVHSDDRGYFRELIRTDAPFFKEGFGQWSHSKMYPGVIKAWHIHKTQVDWWYVPFGRLRVVLHDMREYSSTKGITYELQLGDDLIPAILKIPAGVAHGCRVIGTSVAHLFYITSHTYNLAEEGRIAHDDPSIGYDWLSNPPIK